MSVLGTKYIGNTENLKDFQKQRPVRMKFSLMLMLRFLRFQMNCLNFYTTRSKEDSIKASFKNGHEKVGGLI